MLDPWTIENDMLTPTMKLKRNVAKAKFQAVIDEIYAGTGVINVSPFEVENKDTAGKQNQA